jgi:hypothetical protein
MSSSSSSSSAASSSAPSGGDSGQAVALAAVYVPQPLHVGGPVDTYPSYLRMLLSINERLKKDGILAPSDNSIVHTATLYDLIGKPLNRIPTILVGGTNGKVCV